MVRQLSYSSASALLRCPRQWKYRYVDRLPASPSGSLIAGNVYHKGIAFLYSRKMANLDTTREERLDTTSSFWDEEIAKNELSDEICSVEVETVFWGSKNTPRLVKQKVLTMVDRYAETWLHKYGPTSVEKKYSKEVPGVPVLIVGYIDVEATRLFDSTPIIIDHKWRGKGAPDATLNNDFQSTTYTMLTNREETEFHEAINSGKKMKLQPRIVRRSSDDCEWVEELYRQVWRQIEQEVFPPNPLGFLCSPAYCSYYTQCRLGW